MMKRDLKKQFLEAKERMFIRPYWGDNVFFIGYPKSGEVKLDGSDILLTILDGDVFINSLVDMAIHNINLSDNFYDFNHPTKEEIEMFFINGGDMTLLEGIIGDVCE